MVGGSAQSCARRGRRTSGHRAYHPGRKKPHINTFALSVIFLSSTLLSDRKDTRIILVILLLYLGIHQKRIRFTVPYQAAKRLPAQVLFLRERPLWGCRPYYLKTYEYMYHVPAGQLPIAPAVLQIATSRQSNRLAPLPLSQSVFDRTMYLPG